MNDCQINNCPAAPFDSRHVSPYQFRVACAYWLDGLLKSPDRLKGLVDAAECTIRSTVGEDFHFIAVSGVSGLVLGGLISQRFNRHLVVVRKQRESKHSSRIVEGLRGIEGIGQMRYLIVDDFVSTGGTIRRMRYEIARHVSCCVELLGAYLYCDNFVRLEKDLPRFSFEEEKKYEEVRAVDY
jgi:hypothetical protein